MKNNKVRMNISREMHEWFTAIDGKTNDERMERLKCYKLNSEAIELLYKQRGEHLLVTSNQMLDYQERYYAKRQEVKTLTGWLAISITVSFLLIGYLAYAQGWFL